VARNGSVAREARNALDTVVHDWALMCVILGIVKNVKINLLVGWSRLARTPALTRGKEFGTENGGV
jgi:hypothetical protein